MYSSLHDDSDDEFALVAAGPSSAFSSSPPIRHAIAHGQMQSQTEQDHSSALSPTDGYFHASSPPSGLPADGFMGNSWPRSTGSSAPTSSNVPHVPDVWVADPSLEQGSTADSKAREAEEDRLNHRENVPSHHDAPEDDITPSPIPRSSITSPWVQGTTLSSSTYTPSHQRGASTSSASSQQRYTPYYPGRYTPSTTASRISRSAGHSPTIISERSSFFHHPEAPPAYTPSPTSPSSSSSPLISASSQAPAQSSYSTFPTAEMGQPETERLLGNNAPQSMGGSPGDGDGYRPKRTWRGCVSRIFSFLGWHNTRVAILGLLLVAVTVGFVVSSVSVAIGRGHKGDLVSPNPGSGQPGTKYPDFDNDIPPIFDPSHNCRESLYKVAAWAYDIDVSGAKGLSIKQEVSKDKGNGRNLRVSGEVIFRQSDNSLRERLNVIVLEILSNDNSMSAEVHWDSEAQALTVVTPSMIPWSYGNQEPCMVVRITVWLPKEAAFTSLSVGTVQLDTYLLEDLAMYVAHQSHIEAVSGDVALAFNPNHETTKAARLPALPEFFTFDSRVTEIKTISGDVTGSLPLYDSLIINTVSGDVKLGVAPQDVLKANPRAAALEVGTISGQIELWEPLDAVESAIALLEETAEGLAVNQVAAPIPPRDYSVRLTTKSGDVRGALAVSFQGEIRTISGDIRDLTLLPVLPRSMADGKRDTSSQRAVSLTIDTRSGDASLIVLEPLWIKGDGYGGSAIQQPPVGNRAPSIPIGDGDPYDFLIPHRPSADGSSAFETSSSGSFRTASRMFRTLDGSVSTQSGDLRMVLPAPWEGDVSAETMTGSIEATGNDKLRVIRYESPFPGIHKKLLARKGEEGGHVAKFTSISGDIKIRVEPDKK